MPKSENQKLKLLYLLKLFREKTDENHYVSMPDIIAYLSENGISAERKAIYSDIEALIQFGYEIEGEKIGSSYMYKLAEREFEPFELKLLVDAVQSSKSLTEEKSRQLIKKLECFTSDFNANKIHKQVLVKNRVKTINKTVYYVMDAISEAMEKNRTISFEYRQWSLDKELVTRKNGIKEGISPWAFIWDDESYYVLAFDPKAEKLKHYRMDKMFNVTVSSAEKRQGEGEFSRVDLAVYTKEHFNMYSGEICTVKLECKNSAANFIIDKFGTDIMLVPSAEDSFTVNVEVALSKMFYGWVLGFGGDVKIVSPKSVRKEMKERIRAAAKMYE